MAGISGGCPAGATRRSRCSHVTASIPTVVDESGRGDRAFDIYSLLLRERIVFLGQEVDDQIANLIISQMLYLEAQDPEKDIYLYINSPGGMAYAGMAIYDVIQHVRPEVSTICVGMGMSAAAMVLAGGAPGKRLALPNARIMIHQGSAGTRGAPSDMEIQLREVLALTRRMAEIIAHHSGRPVEEVMKDIDRDYFMTPDEAIAYGLIDAVILPRSGLLAGVRRSSRPSPDSPDSGWRRRGYARPVGTARCAPAAPTEGGGPCPHAHRSCPPRSSRRPGTSSWWRRRQATRALDALAARRRRLPMVRMERSTASTPRRGPVTLLDLFDGREQLAVYQFMDVGPGALLPGVHPLHRQRDRPRRPGRQRGQLGHRVQHAAEPDRAVQEGEGLDHAVRVVPRHDLRRRLRRLGDTAASCSRSSSGTATTVFRTYSTTARGVDRVLFVNNILDLAPYGRQEEWEDSPDGWPQHPTYG